MKNTAGSKKVSPKASYRTHTERGPLNTPHRPWRRAQWGDGSTRRAGMKEPEERPGRELSTARLGLQPLTPWTTATQGTGEGARLTAGDREPGLGVRGEGPERGVPVIPDSHEETASRGQPRDLWAHTQSGTQMGPRMGPWSGCIGSL